MPCPRKSQVRLPPWKKKGRFYRVPSRSLLRVQIKGWLFIDPIHLSHFLRFLTVTWIPSEICCVVLTKEEPREWNLRYNFLFCPFNLTVYFLVTVRFMFNFYAKQIQTRKKHIKVQLFVNYDIMKILTPLCFFVPFAAKCFHTWLELLRDCFLLLHKSS